MAAKLRGHRTLTAPVENKRATVGAERAALAAMVAVRVNMVDGLALLGSEELGCV